MLSTAPLAWDSSEGKFVSSEARRRPTRRRPRNPPLAHDADDRGDQGGPRDKVPRTNITPRNDGDDDMCEAAERDVKPRDSAADEPMHDGPGDVDLHHELGGADPIDTQAASISSDRYHADAGRHAAISVSSGADADREQRCGYANARAWDIGAVNVGADGNEPPVHAMEPRVDTFGTSVDTVQKEGGDYKRRRTTVGAMQRAASGNDGDEAAVTNGVSTSSQDRYQRVLAISTCQSAAVAREGPRGLEDPTFRSDAVAAACPTWDTAAATVAKDVAATTPHLQEIARCPHGRRGKVARGPASGVAAPLEDSEDAAGRRTGQVQRATSQKTPRAVGGGRPQLRRSSEVTSGSTPQRLGTRPSTLGHVLSDDNGLPPTLGKERRRVGNSSPRVQASAAWSCDTAAAQDLWERPQGGRPCRVPSARTNECLNTIANGDPDERPATQARGTRYGGKADDLHPPALGPGRPHDISSSTSTALCASSGPHARRSLAPHTENSTQCSTTSDHGLAHGSAAGCHVDDVRDDLAYAPPLPAQTSEQASGDNQLQQSTDPTGTDSARHVDDLVTLTPLPTDTDEPRRGPLNLRAHREGRDHPRGRHLMRRLPHDGHGKCGHDKGPHAYPQGCHRPVHDELRQRQVHRHEAAARDQPQRSCGDRGGGPAGTSARSSYVKHHDSDVLIKGNPSSVASASGNAHGWAPFHRASTSSASASSHCGISGPPLPSSTSEDGLDTVATGQDAVAGPARVAEARRAIEHNHAVEEYVPAWLRTPSWLYLPHLVPPATVIYAEGEAVRRGDAGDDARARAAQIRGRGTSPGTRRPTPLDRAREKLAARNAHLARSLSDHAERVEKRKAQGGSSTPPVTPAERMAALRRRLAARGREDAQGTSLLSPAAAAAGIVTEAAARAGHSRAHSDDNGCIGSAAMHHAGKGHAAEHAQGMRDRRHTEHEVCRPLAEEVITPEAGKWSSEDPKMHFPLHDQGIQMPRACLSQSHHDRAGGTSSTAAGIGRGNQHRSGEANGRQRGGAAPPDAASEAAASGVAWHTAVNSGCTDR